LLAEAPGFARSAAVATSYFAGFSGVWLAFALFFQDGLGYTPVQSGLAVTPFALGATLGATVSGRLLRRRGPRIVTGGLALAFVGLTATAVVLAVASETVVVGAVVAVPLLVAGVGGGLVVAPNTTLAMQSVPPATAGVVGGVLQTGQRVGAAIGTAAIAGLYFLVLSVTGLNYALAIAASVGGAALGVAGALVIAILDQRHPRQAPSKN
jgi:MFS family permease